MKPPSWPIDSPNAEADEYLTNLVKSSLDRPMKTVNIGDLKARLSAHIQMVKDGEEVLVCERNKPVARIIPCDLEDYSEQEKRLIAKGVLTPPREKGPADLSWLRPVGRVSRKVMERIFREEREDR